MHVCECSARIWPARGGSRRPAPFEGAVCLCFSLRHRACEGAPGPAARERRGVEYLFSPGYTTPRR